MVLPRLASLVTVAAWAWLCLGSVSGQGTYDFVPDGDFEECTSNGGALSNLWTATVEPGTSATVRCSSNAARYNNYSARFDALTPGSGHEISLTDNPFLITVNSPTTTSLAFWLAPEVGGQATFSTTPSIDAKTEVGVRYTFNGQEFLARQSLANVNSQQSGQSSGYGTNGAFRQYILPLPGVTGVGQVGLLAINFTATAQSNTADNVPFYLDAVQIIGSSVIGDPIFTGFHGQVYQVHGLPVRHFNLITSSTTQINTQFVFLGKGDSMAAGEMAKARTAALTTTSGSRQRSAVRNTKQAPALPLTAAWTHEGTFLGSLAIKARVSESEIRRVSLIAGAYETGFERVVLDGQVVIPATFPYNVVDCEALVVTLVSAHTAMISTPEVSVLVVNSDHFFNLERVSLTDLTAVDPSLIDGILGQSADRARYFPHYGPTADAASDIKDDWQQHQILDYLINENDPFSDDFVLNKFNKA